MAITGNEGQVITLQAATDMTAEYRQKNPHGVKAELFGSVRISSILAQAGVLGIRVYYGLTANKDQELIMVGVDVNGNDVTAGVIIGLAPHCPPICGQPNVLNGI